MTEIINTTLQSFDFSYCIIVNALTYVIITIINDFRKHKGLDTWQKRLVLIASILFTGVLYYLIGIDTRILLNSAILAPVFWSWVLKPVCKFFKIDYKNLNIFE